MRHIKKILVQGAKTKEALYHIQVSKNYGTSFLGSFEERVPGLSFFETLPEEVDAVWLLEPHLEALLEVVQAGIFLIVTDLKSLPVHDRKVLEKAMVGKKCHIIEGIIIPGAYRLGTMPPSFFKKGNIALLARSKSLAYEKAYELSQKGGEGQSLSLLLGESRAEDFLEYLKKDPETMRVIEV